MTCGDNSLGGANSEQAYAQPDDFARAGIELVEYESTTITFVGPRWLAAARHLGAGPT
jgi:hypothetical protein